MRTKGLEVENLREHAGLIGWGVVGSAILATEILSPQTLSTASDKILEGNYGRLTRAAWMVGSTILFAHTMNLIPEKVDPIHQVVGRILDKTNIAEWSL